jgi:hypothetical protein
MSGLVRGRPGHRVLEPSDLFATSLRYHRRIVSGVTIPAMSCPHPEIHPSVRGGGRPILGRSCIDRPVSATRGAEASSRLLVGIGCPNPASTNPQASGRSTCERSVRSRLSFDAPADAEKGCQNQSSLGSGPGDHAALKVTFRRSGGASSFSRRSAITRSASA